MRKGCADAGRRGEGVARHESGTRAESDRGVQANALEADVAALLESRDRRHPAGSASRQDAGGPGAVLRALRELGSTRAELFCR